MYNICSSHHFINLQSAFVVDRKNVSAVGTQYNLTNLVFFIRVILDIEAQYSITINNIGIQNNVIPALLLKFSNNYIVHKYDVT